MGAGAVSVDCDAKPPEGDDISVKICYFEAVLRRIRGYTNHVSMKWKNKSSAVAEMCDRLATVDMGRKLGVLCPFPWAGDGYPSNTMWPGPRYTSKPSSILIHRAVWPQQTWAENWELMCPFGELCPHLTQCGLAQR